LSYLHFLNHPWSQLKFLPISSLAQLVPPTDGAGLDGLLARVGVFRPWPPGPRNPDRLPQLRGYLGMSGRGPQSRFCDGSFRVIYAGKTLSTCIAEVAYHHGLALRDSGEPPGAARIFEALKLRTAGRFLDVRKGRPDLHRREDYAPAQAYGRACKAAGEAGILYHSVRKRQGECLAILEGQTVKSCRLEEVVALRWDGGRLRP
jgi:RES domain-containing protein